MTGASALRALPVLGMAAITLACVLIPGWDGIGTRLALLAFPWGALAVGYGTIRFVSWDDRRRREAGLD